MRVLTIATAAWLILGLAACRTTPAAAGCGTAEAPAPAPCACPPPCRVVDLGCWTPPPCRATYADASLSFLPNLGLGIGAGRVFARTADDIWSFEVQGTYQFLDDASIADDGNPEAGDWLQLRAGFKASSNPRGRRHFTKRFGAVVFDAAGDPNIVQEPGTYWGVYGGLGFETDLTPTLTVGPELSVLVTTREDEFEFARPVPQLTWHAIVWLGGNRGTCLTRAPLGELYVGGHAIASPGLGGGLEAGQVFSRSSVATWSLEVLGSYQDASDALAFEEDGKWAQIRGGVKAAFQPCACGHWTARAGVVWLRSTARNEFLDRTGDHVGAYLGGGYEWDIGRRFATGPEVALLMVAREGSSSFEPVVQAHWHFILKL